MSSTPKLPVVVIACKVLQDMLEKFLPAGLASQVTFMDYGLHRVPNKMNWELQQTIDSLPQPSLVVLGYGLCGNGLKGLQSRAHTLLIPRSDDCIAILLGSYAAYMREFEAEPGTYYLTKGWLESGSNPLQEYQEALEKYGPKRAEMIMDAQYRNYKRLILVAHNQEDITTYRPRAQEVARYCERWGMRYEEMLGSDDFVRRLVETAARFDPTEGLLPDDFVIVPPGSEVRQDMFMR